MTVGRIAWLVGIAFLAILLSLCDLWATTRAAAPGELYDVGPDPIAPEVSSPNVAPSPQPQDTQPADAVANEKKNVNGGKDDLEMLDMDLKQLSQVAAKSPAPSLNMEVSTVARTESTVGRSPAAVFVITNEMIRRSGVRNVPEALRLAPGVDVARIDAARWAITIRGFNNRYANKLLVQIDGRSVYSPWFGGVFWDVQNVVLEDVERIEVIRGPGATVWGANAVNGVINIITKSSQDTQGSFFETGGGTVERDFSTFRYGGTFGPDADYRVYGMWFERYGSYTPYVPSFDGTWQGQTGFRADWRPDCCDAMTLQGDYYNGYTRAADVTPGSFPPTFIDPTIEFDRVTGANVLYRWTRTLDDESDWSFQMYYDHALRKDQITTYRGRADTLDLDFQHRLPIGTRHDVIWGCGYRNTDMSLIGIPFDFTVIPPHRHDNLFNYFVQDQITLRDDLLYLIAGSKFEHNDYTGFEYQPSVRLLWTPSERHSLWASVSRAVHTPTYSEADIQLIGLPVDIIPPPPIEVPIFPVIHGNSDVGSEAVLAYEAGIRVQPTDAFYWDLAVFFNRYENLATMIPVSLDPGVTPGGWPCQFLSLEGTNLGIGETYGFELAAGYTLNERWKLRGSYSFLCMYLRTLNPDAQLLFLPGENPRNQFNVWLSGDLGNNWQLDIMGRYVDNLAALMVPHYFVADVRLAWKPSEQLEVFVVGRNLFEQEHMEYGTVDMLGNAGFEIQQEVYGGLAWRF